jgi:hypothetical protein
MIIGSSFTYTIQARGWLIITMKDNKTIEIGFLKNESRTMIIFVSESQTQNMIILGKSLPGLFAVLCSFARRRIKLFCVLAMTMDYFKPEIMIYEEN